MTLVPLKGSTLFLSVWLPLIGGGGGHVDAALPHGTVWVSDLVRGLIPHTGEYKII